MSIKEKVESLIARQLCEWPTARDNYAALANVRVKWVDVDGVAYKVQFNPARIISSSAKVDAATLKTRRCFLCHANRPAEQEIVEFAGHYDILVNPYPIFPRHLTIAERSHTQQSISGRIGDMLCLACELPDFTIFYNGPRCGASAPDHAHFQAGSKGFMPIEQQWKSLAGENIISTKTARMQSLEESGRTTLVISGTDKDEIERMFHATYKQLHTPEGDYEPMLNLLCEYAEERWTLYIFPRTKHRPSCYTADGDDNLLCSPASVDMGGAFIIPRESDFEKIDSHRILQMLNEVCLSKEKLATLEQNLTAGITF